MSSLEEGLISHWSRHVNVKNKSTKTAKFGRSFNIPDFFVFLWGKNEKKNEKKTHAWKKQRTVMRKKEKLFFIFIEKQVNLYKEIESKFTGNRQK